MQAARRALRDFREIFSMMCSGKRKATQRWLTYIIGGSGEIRTRDQRIKSPLLYRLSYRPNPNKRRL